MFDLVTEMSLRAFTVFQDAPSGEQLCAEVTRPNAMATRSLMNSNFASSNNATKSTPDLDKENFDPLTGERAGPGGSTAGKKRKTGVLATKAQRPTDKSSQPEKKKRKPSPPSSNSAETKPAKKSLKSSGKSRKGKRAGSRKVSPMPKLPEEDEVGKVIPATQREIDSRCKELTLKPLADVSEAYDELSVLYPSAGVEGSAAVLGHGTVKVRAICFWKVYTCILTHVSHIYRHHLWNPRFAITLSRPGAFLPRPRPQHD